MLDNTLEGILDGFIGAAKQLAFLIRYYDKLWILLILLSIATAIYIFVDSNRRNLHNIVFWRVAAIVNLALFIPTIVVAFDFLSAVLSTSLDVLALFAYLGVASSVIAVGLAVGYWISYRELAVNDHVKDDDFQIVSPPPPPPHRPIVKPQRASYKPPKPKANAWMIMKSNGKSYQLNRDTTVIGRSSRSDIPILDDPTVSGQHIKIINDNGHFKMIDLGSLNGTWVNGYRVRQPILLDINDEIRLGDNTYMKFIAS